MLLLLRNRIIQPTDRQRQSKLLLLGGRRTSDFEIGSKMQPNGINDKRKIGEIASIYTENGVRMCGRRVNRQTS